MRPRWSRPAVATVALAVVAPRMPLATASLADLPSILTSVAVLRANDSPGTACLAASVSADVLVTRAPCVAELLAARWTAQFVSSDEAPERLVVNDDVDVASLEIAPRSYRLDGTDPSQGIAVVRLRRAPVRSSPFGLAQDSAEDDLDATYSVIHVDLSTLEYALLPNLTRLPGEQCGVPLGRASRGVECVSMPRAVRDSGSSSLLIDASSAPATLIGFGIAPLSTPLGNGTTTAFAPLPFIGGLLSSPSVSSPSSSSSSSASSSSSSSSEDVLVPDNTDGKMDIYVLTPDANGLSQAPSYMAGLRLTKDGANFCGGSLIAPRVVLTAAHCLDSGRVPAFVSIGALATAGDVGPGAELLAVDVVQLHPQYDQSSKANDLALVVLREPSRSHTPVRLENARRLSATRATVYGYGVTRQDAEELSPTLRSVELPLVASRQQCEARFGARLDASFLCAGGEAGLDACTGDSGGPLVISIDKTPSLLGVVSAGDGCGVEGRPGLYTWVGSANAVAFISTHVPDATWTASVRINGVSVPVVASRDDVVEYPQFINASSSSAVGNTGQGTVGHSAMSSPTPQERDGSATTRAPDSQSSATTSPSSTPTKLYRVEFGGEDLTTFTRWSLLQLLAGGSASGGSPTATTNNQGEAASQAHVRFTLVSSARLDTLLAVISRHDTLALHRRRARL